MHIQNIRNENNTKRDVPAHCVIFFLPITEVSVEPPSKMAARTIGFVQYATECRAFENEISFFFSVCFVPFLFAWEITCFVGFCFCCLIEISDVPSMIVLSMADRQNANFRQNGDITPDMSALIKKASLMFNLAEASIVPLANYHGETSKSFVIDKIALRVLMRAVLISASWKCTLQSELEQNSTMIDQLHIEHQQLQSKNQQLHIEHQQLQSKNQQLHIEHQQLQSLNQQLQIEHQQLQSNTKQLQIEHQQLQSQYMQLQSKNQQNENMLNVVVFWIFIFFSTVILAIIFAKGGFSE